MELAAVNSGNSQPKTIPLFRMTQQLDVRVPEDDWTGVTSTAERRRLQNRLNQRAWRRRQTITKQAAHRMTGENVSQPLDHLQQWKYSELSDSLDGRGCDGDSGQSRLSTSVVRRSGTLCNLDPAKAQEIIDSFETRASTHARLGSPRADLLLTLTRFNVFRALVSNAHALGFTTSWLQDDAVSAFNTANASEASALYPRNLRPSTLQLTVPHHPWLDLLPFPAMRDNILKLGESFDDTPFCLDIVEFCHVSGDGGGTGLIVWGNPSDPSNWEVSEGMLRKWGWLLSGCWELFRGTNYWRSKRGERNLFSLPESSF